MNPCQVIHSIANSYFQGWGIKKGISPAPFLSFFLVGGPRECLIKVLLAAWVAAVSFVIFIYILILILLQIISFLYFGNQLPFQFSLKIFQRMCTEFEGKSERCERI